MENRNLQRTSGDPRLDFCATFYGFNQLHTFYYQIIEYRATTFHKPSQFIAGPDLLPLADPRGPGCHVDVISLMTPTTLHKLRGEPNPQQPLR